MKKMKKTPLAAAMGTAMISTFAAAAVQAEANPFGMSELSGGYMQVAEAEAAKGGEMKCGANMKMDMKEGKCGAGMMGGEMKMEEGKCAGKKAEKAEAKATEDKSKEGKCGEGKCASMMQGGKMKKGMEGACGEMMKGKEGACGEMMKKEKAGGE
ncbi:MAG: HvfA family oxazolone/thioamide-modified RiPP metallophore [Gammaproteobacteria bacterium]